MMQWRVNDVMDTDVAVAYEDTPVTKIIEILASPGVCAVVILDHREQLVGVVSPDDLLPTISALHGSARAPHRRRPVKAAATQAWQLLNSPALTVSAEAPLSAAAERIRAKRVSHLVATDESGKPLGVVTTRDLYRLRGARDGSNGRNTVERSAGRIADATMAGSR